ncbi:MAG: hypothetical protein J6I49_00405 [Bacteroidales bacterium]|nr:hypothetical protein [Bacteroidales bacterium]
MKTYTAPALTVVNFRTEQGFVQSNMHVLNGNNSDNGQTEEFGWQDGMGRGSNSFWGN